MLSLHVPAFGKIYEKFEPVAYPVLRIGVGLLFVPHGAQKLFQMFGGRPLEVYQAAFGQMGQFWAHPFWVYYIGSLEFFGGVLVAIGFFTRIWAAQFVLFMLIGAAFSNSLRGWFWTVGGSEMPVLLALLMWYILVNGSGRLSVDSAIGKEI